MRLLGIMRAPVRERSRLVCILEPLERRTLLSAISSAMRSLNSIRFNPIWAEELRQGSLKRAGRGILAPAELQAESAPALSGTISAITFDQNAATTGFYQIPPDPHAAAGPDHLVNIINSTIEWYTKDGVLQNRQRLGKHPSGSIGISGSFFEPVNPANSLFDPKVIYDQYANRFVVVVLEQQDKAWGDPVDDSRILLAVSDDADPNGTWHYAAINSKIRIQGRERWADYPGLGVDSQAVYITGNMFAFGNNASYGGSRLWIVNKSGWYSGGAASVTVHDPSSAAGLSSQAFTLQPAHLFGTAPSNTGTFLVNSGWISGATDFLSVIRVSNPLSSPSFNNQFVNLGDVHNTSVSFPSGAPQLGTTETIHTGDNRVLNAVWRDNALWAINTVNPPSGIDAGTATAHWYRIDTSNLSSLTLSQQGDVSGEDIAPGTRTFWSAIMVDAAGNMGIGFAASGPNIYPGAYYTGRLATDPPNTVQPTSTLAAGMDYYVRKFGGSRNRWGDYSGLALDPTDEATFWLYNEYAMSRGTVLSSYPAESGRYATVYGSFSFTGDISGLVFRDINGNGVLDAGETALSGVSVYLDLNNNGVHDPGEPLVTSTAGGFTFSGLAAGNYLVRHLPTAGYIPTTGSLSVSVSSGATTIANLGNFPVLYVGTAGVDTYTLRLDPSDTSRVQILENRSGTLRTYGVAMTTLSSSGALLEFFTLGSDDTFTIDYTDGSPIPAGGVLINAGAGTGDHLIVVGSSADDTITIDNGTIVFGGAVTYSNVEFMTLSSGDGNDTLNFNGPVAPAVTFNGGSGQSTLNVNGGTFTFSNDAGVTTDNLAINVNAGNVVFNASQRLQSLAVAAGAAAVMPSHGSRLLYAKSLLIDSAGRLDLNDNGLLVDYTGTSPYTTLLNHVLSGYRTSLDPAATGIVSTSSQLRDGQTILVLLDNQSLGLTEWEGWTIDSTTIIGKYTVFGDANLDGQVTGDDFALVVSNLGMTENACWILGDMNFDGMITGDDVALVVGNLGETV